MSKCLRMSEEQFAALMGHKKLPSADKTTKGKTVAIAGGYRSRVSGERTIGGKTHYFRSLWEIQFAQYLEFQKKHGEIIDWEYEPRKFDFPIEVYGRSLPHSYLPDFRIVYKNGFEEYAEVKGVLTAISKKKIKRLNETYPEINLKVYGKPWFTAARRKGFHNLMGWEKLPIED